MMHGDDVKYWLALKAIDGIGNASISALSCAFRSLRDVFSASPETLSCNRGLNRAQAEAIAGFSQWDKINKTIDQAHRLGIHIVTRCDESYPARLLTIYDSPPVLFIRGGLDPDEICVAVVGSRQASAYGRYTTQKISRELALAGVTIVSGMARGIDSCAHRGALSAKGRTLAVLGCGPDVVYPPENRKLFNEILENGALISEYPPGTEPLPYHFPARNRIISGLSYGVLVVEAGEKSGSLITARLAAEQGREVFAIPGTIDSASSRGANSLIKQGAKLIDHVDDILEEIAPQVEKCRPDGRQSSQDHACRTDFKETPDAASNLSAFDERLLKLLPEGSAVQVDELLEKSELDAKDVLSGLITLEIKGMIEQYPGKLFARKK